MTKIIWIKMMYKLGQDPVKKVFIYFLKNLFWLEKQ